MWEVSRPFAPASHVACSKACQGHKHTVAWLKRVFRRHVHASKSKEARKLVSFYAVNIWIFWLPQHAYWMSDVQDLKYLKQAQNSRCLARHILSFTFLGMDAVGNACASRMGVTTLAGMKRSEPERSGDMMLEFCFFFTRFQRFMFWTGRYLSLNPTLKTPSPFRRAPRLGRSVKLTCVSSQELRIWSLRF